MTVGYMARSSGPQHASAARRLTGAREEQCRLAGALAGSQTPERLSASRADVASSKEWLHWIEHAESLEPWADGEWAPEPLARTEEVPSEMLVELLDTAPGGGSTSPAASWVVPALPVCVRELRARVAGFARAHGVDDVLIVDLQLAASEAITNAVMHAFRDRVMPGTVAASITVDKAAGRVEVIVSDDGMGMTPRPDSPGAGLGLPIISRLSDELSIRPGAIGIGTEVRMIFTGR